MAHKQSFATIIKEQRKSIPLSLRQLSELSGGVSIAHLGRIEQGKRRPSPLTLQKVANHGGFDLEELLAMAGFLYSKRALFSEE